MSAKVENVNVYGFAESIYRSGYPMMKEAPSNQIFAEEVRKINEEYLINDHVKRAIKLANMSGGGHDQFLTGITVTFDLTLSNKAWVEAERYTFLNFISSMSTMHRAAFFPIGDMCNEYVNGDSIGAAEDLQAYYNRIDGDKYPNAKKDAYLELLYSLPSGFELMAGMVTNYRCLKNIYAQRRNHRLPDWHVVCDWIESLPLAKQLIIGKNTDKE